MQNVIDRSVTGLIIQSQRALPGVILNEIPLGLALIKPNPFAAKIAGLVSDVDVYDKAKALLATKREALDGVVETCRTFTGLSREVINVFIGKVHSPTHVIAGFRYSLRIPRKPG